MYASIGDSVWKTIEKLGLDKKIKEKIALELWSEVVGEEVKKHTWPESMRNGIMTVVADSPSWCQQLSLLRINYIRQINEKLAKKVVKEIRFKTGSIKVTGIFHEEQEAAPEIRLSDRDKIRINQESSEIRDKELGFAYEKFLEFVKKLEKQRELAGWTKCEKCGKQIPQNEKYCLSCNKNELKTKEIMVEQFLYEVPWISYEQINKLIPALEKSQFNSVKKNLINKTREKLDYRIKLKKDKEQLKFLAYFLTMLISGENPANLNNEKIEQILKINLSKIS